MQTKLIELQTVSASLGCGVCLKMEVKSKLNKVFVFLCFLILSPQTCGMFCGVKLVEVLQRVGASVSFAGSVTWRWIAGS